MEKNFLKLTSKTYKLLEFLPESDPLKNRAKNKVLEIMENFGKADISEDVDVLLGYLDIAKLQGWISSVNLLIICNEYEKLKTTLGRSSGEKSREETGRQGAIMDFLRQHGRAQVMDLQAILKDVTKRTIRRDLDELLQAGKIIREGEFNQIIYKIRGRT